MTPHLRLSFDEPLFFDPRRLVNEVLPGVDVDVNGAEESFCPQKNEVIRLRENLPFS